MREQLNLYLQEILHVTVEAPEAENLGTTFASRELTAAPGNINLTLKDTHETVGRENMGSKVEGEAEAVPVSQPAAVS